MTWFSPRTVLFGVRMMNGKNPPKRGINTHFQAKLPKTNNYNISQTIHPIGPKFDDKTHTINNTAWVVHHYHTGNTTWLTSAILKININKELGR